MAADTTVKVTKRARDRINARARAQGIAPGIYLERLVEEDERRQRFADVRASYAALATDDDYHAETAEWDATASDGLDEIPANA